ncbi:hypothetical protein Tco_0347779 [Tanacetum coccineum]
MEIVVDVVVGIDIPNSMLMLDVVEHLEQVEEVVQDIYGHVMEIEDIKMVHRELEARSLIASGKRASLLEQVASLERSNARLRGTVIMESARADRLIVEPVVSSTEIPTISPIVPPSPVYTPTSHDYSLASDTEFDPSEDPSPDRIPPLLAISPFLSSTDDSSDSDIPDTPPSPTHGTPFTEITLSTQSSPASSVTLCRRVMILAPGQHIPHGRPSNHRLCSLVPSIPHSSAVITERPSAILLIESSRRELDLEDNSDDDLRSSVPRETSLRDDVVVRGSDEPHSEPDIDLEIQAEIDEYITYADALRAKGIDARVMVETVA